MISLLGPHWALNLEPLITTPQSLKTHKLDFEHNIKHKTTIMRVSVIYGKESLHHWNMKGNTLGPIEGLVSNLL